MYTRCAALLVLLLSAVPGILSAPVVSKAGTSLEERAQPLKTLLSLAAVESGRTILERERRQDTGEPCNHCITHVYVFAQTSYGSSGYGADISHNIQIIAQGIEYTATLHDLPKDDASEGKGDLWKMNLFDDFGVPSEKCIRKTDISYVGLQDGGNDGWKIDSIVTIFKYVDDGYEVATLDMDVHQWLDGNGNPISQPGVTNVFELTLT